MINLHKMSTNILILLVVREEKFGEITSFHWNDLHVIGMFLSELMVESRNEISGLRKNTLWEGFQCIFSYH